MSNTDRIARGTQRPAYGPHAVFVVSALFAFLVLATPGQVLLPDLALPMAIMLLFGLAAIACVFAWRSRQRRASTQLTYWDVAGALALIGIGLSVLIEPDQMVALVEARKS